LSAFTGTGTLNEPFPAGKVPGATGPITRSQVVNYSYNPIDGYVIDPERQTEPGAPAVPATIPFRGAAQLNTPPNAAFGGNYINKAAPYTYPDRNNFFLAQMNPATGEIILPSFHRPDLFTNTNFTNPAEQIAQSLNPNNLKWTSAEGRLMTLRPTRLQHPNFPQVPPNADGTFTGDVSNLRFITGSQKNDSLWTDFGGPVLEWRGRKYKAMIAPLILDLSSRINLSVAGNIRLGDTVPTNPTTFVDRHPRHTSTHGFGPWEVNPTAAFPTQPTAQNWELYSLLRQRFPNPTTMPIVAGMSIFYGAFPQQDLVYRETGGRLGHLTQPLYTTPQATIAQTGLLPPSHSRIDLDGVSTTPFGVSDPLQLPTAGTSSPFPVYPATRFSTDQNSYNGALRFHPSMYNPFIWKRGLGTSTHPFGNDDAIKWMTRYTDSKDRYFTSDLYRRTAEFMSVPANVGGTALTPTNINTPLFRALTTTFSTSQNWAEVSIQTTPTTAVNLGPIDVNRPLADYRKTAVWLNPGMPPAQPRFEPVPHSPINLWNPNLATSSPEPVHYAKARQARQNLARDIFVRMVALAGVADGTNISYNPASGYLNPIDVQSLITADSATWTPRFAQIRQFAQLAANIVDYIDPDDISTAFVWNPINANFQAQFNDGTGNTITDPTTSLPIQDPSADPLNYAPITISDRVVYGTELPRLVINEAYCVLENTRNPPETFPGGRASRPMVRRYWVELHNPLPADATPPVLSDGGAARLQYQAGVTQLQDPTNPATLISATGTYNPYRLEVAVAPAVSGPTPYTTFLTASPGTRAVADTASVPLMTMQARINNYTQDVTAPAPAAPTLPVGSDAKNVVLPANGALNDAGTKNQGYYVIGPRDQFPDSIAINSLSLPDPTTPGIPDGTTIPFANSLTFDATAAAPTSTDVTTERGKTSVVILRRLANPYLPGQEDPTLPNYNPYMTVDYIENLPSWDRVGHDSTATRTPTPGDDVKPAIGRVHPYAAFPTYGTGTPQDGVRDQVATAPTTTPPNTLFGANNPTDSSRGTALNPLGLEWLVHLDRQLINSLELLHVSTQSPALLTHKFHSERLDAATSMPFAPRAFEYQRHTTWTDRSTTANPATDPLVPALRDATWHRILDLIVCGNRMPGIPIGGREPGKINPNTINDQRLLNAVLDPQQGNSFFLGAYAQNPDIVDPVSALPAWNGLVGTPSSYARTPNPNGVPRATIAETVTPSPASDRPFRSFSGSADIQDTLLRNNPLGNPNPVLFNSGSVAYGNTLHSYAQAEPLRKMLNSLTPTSDSFLMVMTVGFFEVENNGPYSVLNQPRLGKELFDRVPGDLRSQYAAIADRSQLSVELDPTSGLFQAKTPGTELPRQLKLLRDANIGATSIIIEAGSPATGAPGCIHYENGEAKYLTDGSLLRLGNGDFATGTGDGETVRIAVSTVPQPSVTQLLAPDTTGNPTIPVPGHFVVRLDPTFAVNPTISRYHAANSKVGTAVMGNPGPQTGISLEQLRTRGLVPYLTRIDP
jgi:hypothetical protein